MIILIHSLLNVHVITDLYTTFDPQVVFWKLNFEMNQINPEGGIRSKRTPGNHRNLI